MTWEPTTFTELSAALVAGTIVESASVEFKSEINNDRLARSIASLAIDGGTLLIGVDNDGSPAPIELAGQRERIDQVAWSRITPGLSPRVWTLEDPDTSGMGVVVIAIDASPQAPHMVNDRYPTRVGATTGYLSDGEVGRLMERRRLATRDASEELAAYQRRDPVPGNGTAHLFVVAVPRLAASDLLVAAAGGSDLTARLQTEVVVPVNQDVGADWFPKIGREISTFATRGDGVAFVNSLDPMRQPTGEPEQTAELEISESGTIRLYTARASDASASTGEQLLFSSTCIGLTMQTLHAARRIADIAGYRGPWACGIAITNLGGIPAYTTNWMSVGQSIHPDSEYKQLAAATAGDIQHPERVGWRLLGRFLRTLRLDHADHSNYGLPPLPAD